MFPYAPVSMRRDDRGIEVGDWVNCQRPSRMAFTLTARDRHLISPGLDYEVRVFSESLRTVAEKPSEVIVKCGAAAYQEAHSLSTVCCGQSAVVQMNRQVCCSSPKNLNLEFVARRK